MRTPVTDALQTRVPVLLIAVLAALICGYWSSRRGEPGSEEPVRSRTESPEADAPQPAPIPAPARAASPARVRPPPTKPPVANAPTEPAAPQPVPVEPWSLEWNDRV